MIRVPARETNYWTASRWLSFAVSATVIAALAAVLLDSLAEIEEHAEAMMVDVTLRNMRTGLMVAKGEAIIAGREDGIAAWAGRNPVDWLAGPPGGYEGLCGGTASPAAGGWCFDATKRELRYRPRNDRRLRIAGAPEDRVIRWRTASRADRGGGLNVEKVAEYEWVFE